MVSNLFIAIISSLREKTKIVTLLSIALNTRHNLIRIDAPLPIYTISVSIEISITK